MNLIIHLAFFFHVSTHRTASVKHTIRQREAGSYVDVLQVQRVQILMVPLPQHRRPSLPRDGTRQHGALADGCRGDAHFLVIRESEQVHICWREAK